jgi:hypothetical protein
MDLRRVVWGFLLIVSAGGCAAPGQSGSSQPTTPTPTAMTVLECKNLGCATVEASTCPAIMHDYLLRHWACNCAGGSTCIDENSPH